MLLSSWQKTKNKVLALLILDSFCYFMQYLLLGAFSGAFTNIVGLIRILIFKYKSKYIFFQNKILLYIIIAIYLIIGMLTYNGLVSTLPTLGAIIYTSVLWQEDIKLIRIGTVIMILAYFIYNILVSAYIGAIAEGILLISSILSIIKLDVLDKNKEKYKYQNRYN